MRKLDPFYWYLLFAHRKLLRAQLKEEDQKFIMTNINKHRAVQWINAIACIFIILSLRSVAIDQVGDVITALIAPVMVMGTAWFAISFGAIPEHLIQCSLDITFWMFLAFKVSFSAMFLSIAFISPWTLWPVLVLINIAVDYSCSPYDTADGLKAGLDDAQLNHSRAALLFYAKQGIEPQNTQN